MLAQQKDRIVPAELVPHCPVCGAPMTMNLRCDTRFVEDAGWHEAKHRYETFLSRHQDTPVLYFELGVGFNTPGIIKLPFWRLTAQNKNAAYACVNLDEAMAPEVISDRSICLQADVGDVLQELAGESGPGFCRTDHPL